MQFFENQYINEHTPFNKTIRILCKNCHTIYDRGDVIDFDEEEPIVSETKEVVEKLELNNLVAKDKQRLIEKWNIKRTALHHRTIAIFIKLKGDKEGLNRSAFVEELTKYGYKNAYGTVSSMMSDSANNYGLIFEEKGHILQFNASVESEILKYKWYDGITM